MDEDHDQQDEEERHERADQKAVGAENRLESVDQALPSVPDCRPASGMRGCSTSNPGQSKAGSWIRALALAHRRLERETGRRPGDRGRRARAPIRYRAIAAATSPSTRSITPPWPGMMAAGILLAVLALDPGFEEVAGLRHDRQQRARPRRAQPDMPAPAAIATTAAPAMTPPARAAKRAAAGLARRNRRRELRAADRAADEIGQDVGRPDDGEEEDDRDGARRRRPRAAGQRQAGERGIGEAADVPASRAAQTAERRPAPPRGPSTSAEQRHAPACWQARRRRRQASARPEAGRDRHRARRCRWRAATCATIRRRWRWRWPRPAAETGRPPAQVIARTTTASTMAEMILVWRLLIARSQALLDAALRATRPPKRRSRAAYCRKRIGEMVAREVRPVAGQEDQFAVGRLPEQEVRQAHLAAGADDEIRVRNVARVQCGRESLLRDRVRRERRRAPPARRSCARRARSRRGRRS